MLVPVKWLKEYVDIDIDAKELADRLTMSGSHVDSIDSIDSGIENVVVGKILEIQRHPDADKLVVTIVDVGEEKVQIVTGADNIKVGDYIPVALVGAKLPGGVKIKKGKLRGVESCGMLCSAQELGINDNVVSKENKDGIFILDKEYTLGQDIKETLGLYGEVIDFEITPNRSDCLSIIGMARETAATLGKAVKYPKIEIKNEVDDIKDYVNGITVQDKDLCKRYYAKVVKDIKIEPSPMWMQRRLMEAGVRPINNIVDITNYVMLEVGQPLHAFDLDVLEGKKIIIRRAEEGEKIITLDDVERTLDSTMLVIADEKKPVGIAGVMGGEDSGVTEKTKNILIESANFNGRSVRLTSRKTSLRTEASAKFEKDIDPNLVDMACNRVCQLIEEIGAGTVVKNHIDIYEGKLEERVMELSPEKANKLLGTSIEPMEMVRMLNALELKAKLENHRIVVEIPSFRRDLEIEADLIEEVGRIYGLHRITPQPILGTLVKAEKSIPRQIEDKAKNILTGIGLNEITTYSFISPKQYDKLNISDESMKRKYVEIRNPLGEDYSVMRTTLIGNTLDVLTRNYKHGVEKAWTYEIGNTFIPKELPVADLPYENRTLCIGMYGESDFFKIKGVADLLLDKLGIKDYEYIREKNDPTFHPGRTANITLGNHVLGIIGEVHPDVSENYGMKERVYVAELSFDLMILASNLEKKYTPLPKYPSVTRDIALVLNEDIMVKEIEKIIMENGKKLVEAVKLFDVYKGGQVEAGKKSVAYSITYRSHDKTLTDDDVSQVHNKIVEELKEKLNATLRS
ncbi:phenylalanyl-tRNA synthetase beta subunit [Proteiniborus ethanoligenes]|uniref:Phenylalanine--tRNA ligase beta subunit n=1 Tax=Proteiniborus ethanoligenes TaxID=415015 RepID=A0A1H3RV37_9FIRM|nr:phenylalanine--tRNA ligase subunit beta [Proteiniborus ethanoligenes]SDZ29563.1 phenylalanyl-tRNA synthetase beta subunit [Proteiniborus ethanoligenes]